MIKLKRVYEKTTRNDGFRILVDRLWPRGVSKEKAALDLWLKDIAPSDALRKWFGHDPKKWPSFQKKYKSEITTNKEVFKKLKEIVRQRKNVTLLYAAKDEEHNEAIVIKDFVGKHPMFAILEKQKVCSRGHTFKGGGPCPICWPGHYKQRKVE